MDKLEISAVNVIICLSLLLPIVIVFVSCEVSLYCLQRPRNYFEEAKKLDKKIENLREEEKTSQTKKSATVAEISV
ncbi:hypothetical protein L5515_017677 [Caenorhabditis briggsae]|uniref:Transmembrane protein n=1 Tax=Caenorhabditis briggsae TaxID=6238 RepID=A0AAE9JSZ5_CAEBR|nr:hypothetical protein L5515_017677 [Caenorhabditis briggsae]